MRTVCGILSLVLVGFAAVQWNDPDALFWASAYGVGAIWCALAAFRPALLRTGPARALLAASVAVAALGVLAFWPPVAHWWSIDVWWPEISGEPAREGMGIMILTACILAAATVGWRRA